MPEGLLPILERCTGRRVLLVGDFMLDRYIFGDADRISPEAPVPVLRVIDRQDRVGGAGSVAMNIAALGAKCVCCGVVGKDTFGDRVVQTLAEAGCDTDGLARVNDRPTITKTRLVGLAEHRHRQQILRVDDELVQPLSAEDERQLLACVEAHLAQVDVVCLEDYAKGVLSTATAQGIIAAARRHGKPVLVDPARAPVWSRYAGATLLTPNRAELEIACGRHVPESELESAAHALLDLYHLDGLLVTLGRDGSLLVRRTEPVHHFPTVPRAVYDNTGAGDAVLAMFAVAVAAGATFEQAAVLANVAGGLEVSKFGCVPITQDEVRSELVNGVQRSRGKLRTLPELKAELEARRHRGETIVFTNGLFDILHPGHVELLEKAKALGSVLVVGINSDDSCRRQGKAPGRPIRAEQHRVRMLTALEAVDYVVIFDETSVLPLVQEVSPDVLVKGGDYTREGVVGYEWVESHGGRVVVIPFVEGFSTTQEIERIRAAERQKTEPRP
jgi:D-beta-D-heptose 7-phosphate kinase / D-beta-D-heptose 1-phosphate adenosyltransferase